jgi:hypothetical protein
VQCLHARGRRGGDRLRPEQRTNPLAPYSRSDRIVAARREWIGLRRRLVGPHLRAFGADRCDSLDVDDGRQSQRLARAGGRPSLRRFLRRAALRARSPQRPPHLEGLGATSLGGGGTFYSTPAVAYGRVYIGSTDGKVYSFGARSGRLRWSHSTGGYVYASPAVWHRLVLVGSYDHTFYAFDAATGDVRWSFRANGPISGSATVLDDVVYFSTFAKRTYALAAATGRLLWTWPDGKYSPVVSDGRRVYLTGLGRLYGLVSRS